MVALARPVRVLGHVVMVPRASICVVKTRGPMMSMPRNVKSVSGPMLTAHIDPAMPRSFGGHRREGRWQFGRSLLLRRGTSRRRFGDILLRWRRQVGRGLLRLQRRGRKS